MLNSSGESENLMTSSPGNAKFQLSTFFILASNKMNNFNLLTDLANNASAANFETDQKSHWSGFKNTWNDESSGI